MANTWVAFTVCWARWNGNLPKSRVYTLRCPLQGTRHTRCTVIAFDQIGVSPGMVNSTILYHTKWASVVLIVRNVFSHIREEIKRGWQGSLQCPMIVWWELLLPLLKLSLFGASPWLSLSKRLLGTLVSHSIPTAAFPGSYGQVPYHPASLLPRLVQRPSLQANSATLIKSRHPRASQTLRRHWFQAFPCTDGDTEAPTGKGLA